MVEVTLHAKAREDLVRASEERRQFLTLCQIEVIDYGPGIEADVRERLFTRVRTELGKGSTFHVRLPARVGGGNGR
jgi:signal transduction histidine kinase